MSGAASNGDLEQKARQFQKKFDSMLEEFTIKTLPLQKAAFQCCVRCFDVNEENYNQIGYCITQCHKPGEAVTRYVQSELEVLQSKLENCQKTCYNRFTDEAISGQRKRCIVQCFNDAEPYMKEISDRVLKRIKEQT